MPIGSDDFCMEHQAFTAIPRYYDATPMLGKLVQKRGLKDLDADEQKLVRNEIKINQMDVGLIVGTIIGALAAIVTAWLLCFYGGQACDKMKEFEREMRDENMDEIFKNLDKED